jgi:hypothetical protein
VGTGAGLAGGEREQPAAAGTAKKEQESMSCKTCRFHHYDEPNGTSECRRYPPIVIATTDDPDELVTVWPDVDDGEWCGEEEDSNKYELMEDGREYIEQCQAEEDARERAMVQEEKAAAGQFRCAKHGLVDTGPDLYPDWCPKCEQEHLGAGVVRVRAAIGALLDSLRLPGHAVTREQWEELCCFSGRRCEPFLSVIPSELCTALKEGGSE